MGAWLNSVGPWAAMYYLQLPTSLSPQGLRLTAAPSHLQQCLAYSRSIIPVHWMPRWGKE